MNSREKGKRGERQWRDELRAQGYAARRGQQFSGSPESPDVVCPALPWIHFEVKAVERLNIEEAMEQARRDARLGMAEGRWQMAERVPMVAHRRRFRAWLVTMEAETFFKLLRGDFAGAATEEVEPREFWWRTGRARRGPAMDWTRLKRNEQEQQKERIVGMKIKANNSNFEPCPEFTGKAVCVDVTPLRKQQSQYGERDVFKIVFEVDMDREDGGRYCVWSNNFTPTLNEKSSLRKFARGWFGRDLTKAELEDFDTETLIGRAAQLVVVHQHRDNQVYANIAACTPDKSGEPLKPSGKFVRAKDRPTSVGANGAAAGTSVPANAADAAGGGGGYRRAQGLAAGHQEEAGSEHALVKIHVGRCKGLELRDLAAEQVQALVINWLPTAKANAKPTADDRRLMAALEWWQAEQEKLADNVPY